MFQVNKLQKMKHHTALGSRIALVHNGSALFTGDAGQGESNIRRWALENDWLEAIIALPLNIFYNTGIATYIWVLANKKAEARRGKVQLIDASQWFQPLRRNLGKKNCELSDGDIQRILDLYLGEAQETAPETENSKWFDTQDFGYWKITVERPLRLKSQLCDELSMVNVGIPAIDTIAGNPKGTIAVGQMAFKIFLKTFGPDAAKEALSSREALKIFFAKKENRAKQKLLIRALKTMVTHPPASLTGGIKSSSVHSVCETNNPIFSNPLQISDQDWWTLTSNGTAPQLTHVFFPNTSLLSIFQGPMVKSLYPLTSLRLEYSRLVQNPSGDVMVVEASQVVLVRNTDMEAKGTS